MTLELGCNDDRFGCLVDAFKDAAPGKQAYYRAVSWWDEDLGEVVLGTTLGPQAAGYMREHAGEISSDDALRVFEKISSLGGISFSLSHGGQQGPLITGVSRVPLLGRGNAAIGHKTTISIGPGADETPQSFQCEMRYTNMRLAVTQLSLSDPYGRLVGEPERGVPATAAAFLPSIVNKVFSNAFLSAIEGRHFDPEELACVRDRLKPTSWRTYSSPVNPAVMGAGVPGRDGPA